MQGKSFIAHVDEWTRKYHGTKNLSIKLVAPLINDVGPYAYLILTDINTSTHYPFMLGRSGEALNGKFISDYSGNILDYKHNEWVRRMKDYAINNYESDGINRILNQALRSYDDVNLIKSPTTKKISSSPSRSFPKMKPISRLAEILNAAAYTAGALKINVQNTNEWSIKIFGKYTEITARLYISDNLKISPILNVIKPRLSLGKNVSFGGLVQYNGLTQSTWDQKYSELPKRILYSLYNEEPDSIHYEPYHPRELNASQIKFNPINTTSIKKRLGQFVVLIDNSAPQGPQDIGKSDVIYIHPDDYVNNIGGADLYLLFGLETKLGIHGTYVAAPGNDINLRGRVVINFLQATNLNLIDGDNVNVYIYKEQLANNIILRPRSDTPIDDLRNEFEEFVVLSAGHTISFELNGFIEYVDIISVGKDVVGTELSWGYIRSERKGAQIPLGIEDALVTKRDPLEVIYEDYDEEEDEG